MVQCQALRDALRDVYLALQTIDTSISTVRLRHDTADAAADHRSLQNGCVDSCTVNFATRTTRIRLIASIVIVYGILKFCILLSINSWFKEHIVFTNLVLF